MDSEEWQILLGFVVKGLVLEIAWMQMNQSTSQNLTGAEFEFIAACKYVWFVL